MYNAQRFLVKFKQTFLSFLLLITNKIHTCVSYDRSSRPVVFLRKGVLKICSKLTGEHPCRSVILIKLQCNFIEITFRYGCSSVNLLLILGTHFPKNTSGWLLQCQVNSVTFILYFTFA